LRFPDDRIKCGQLVSPPAKCCASFRHFRHCQANIINVLSLSDQSSLLLYLSLAERFFLAIRAGTYDRPHIRQFDKTCNRVAHVCLRPFRIWLGCPTIESASKNGQGTSVEPFYSISQAPFLVRLKRDSGFFLVSAASKNPQNLFNKPPPSIAFPEILVPYAFLSFRVHTFLSLYNVPNLSDVVILAGCLLLWPSQVAFFPSNPTFGLFFLSDVLPS